MWIRRGSEGTRVLGFYFLAITFQSARFDKDAAALDEDAAALDEDSTALDEDAVAFFFTEGSGVFLPFVFFSKL